MNNFAHQNKFYPEKISDRLLNLRFTAKMRAFGATGGSSSLVCGVFVCISIAVDPVTGQISAAGFSGNGCGWLTAAADCVCEWILGKRIIELHGLDDAEIIAAVELALNEFAPARRHCLELAIEAVHYAFSDYRIKQLTEWNGESALVCTCFGISEDKIERLISENWIKTVAQVTSACGAGGGCGSCRPLIQDMLDSETPGF
jgi:NifU-like protein